MILDRLKQKALNCAKRNKLKLVNFEICDLFTYAVVSDGTKEFTGVTLTPKKEGCLSKAAFLDIKEVLESSSYDISQRAVTLALVNAIGQYKLSKDKIELKGNIQQELSTRILENTTDTDKIVFIGHLSPVVAKLKENGRDVKVFCRMGTEPDNGVYNDIFEYEAVAKATVVIITGASLIGSTIDALLKFTQNARAVVIAGFSAGAHPAWFEDTGLTHVVSTYLEDFSPEIIKKNNLEDVFKNPSYVYKLKSAGAFNFALQ